MAPARIRQGEPARSRLAAGIGAIRLLLGVATIGIAVSLASAFLIARFWEDENARLELDALGDNRRLLLQNALNALEADVRDLAHRVQSSHDELDQSELTRAVRERVAGHDDTLRVDWAPFVRGHERDPHERVVRARLYTDYRITVLGADGQPVVAEDKDEYFPILFSAPAEAEARRLGLDIAFDAAHRAAMERARRDGTLAAVRAERDTDIYLFAPVYKYGLPHDTPEERIRNLEGFIRLGPLRGALIDRILRGVRSPQGLDISFFRERAAPTDLPFHIRSSLLRSQPAEPRQRGELEAGPHWSGEIDLAGTRWGMIATPIPGGSPLVTRELSRMALAAGLLLSLGAVVYVELTRRYTARLERVGAELRASDEKLFSILGSIDNIIWSIDAVTHETVYLNPAAERLYGRPASAFYADPELFMKIVHPEDRPRVAAMIPELVEKGVTSVQYRVVHPDGEIRWLEDRAAIARAADGRVVRFNGVATDVTARETLAAASEYRSELLHLSAEAAEELLTSATFQDSISDVLERIGTVVRADRVVVFESMVQPGEAARFALRHAWHSSRAPVVIDEGLLSQSGPPCVGADPWLAPFAEGHAVSAVPRTMQDSAAKSLFQALEIRSILVLPITVDGKPWGRLDIHDCANERDWASVEVDTLRALAEMIGSVIMRERYIQQLKDANTIIERSPIVLYRMRGEPSLPLSYVSHNITLFGYEPAQLIASPELYKSFIHPDDRPEVLESLAAIVHDGSTAGTIEFRMCKSDGAYRWVENRFVPIHDRTARLVEVEGVLTDVTERKEAAERIAHLARTDALTGLANRATFIDRLRQAFAAARRGAAPFAVLYLDLDRFKDINDTLGHPAGDILLEGVARRLEAVTRQSDLVARFGGDEFAILQTELIELSSAGSLAEKIHHALSEPYPLGRAEMHIGASIGIAPFTAETEGPDDMLAQADLALYRAKEEGRDQFCFHSADLDRDVHERLALANELRLALEQGQLALSYQPQVELGTGRIVGMEALLRWNHPRRGHLTPGDFLPAVEKSNLMTSLGQWVLDHACAQMSTWRQRGIAPPILAINLSLVQLRTGDEFVSAVMECLARWGLSPADLELDVTESMLAHVTLHKNNVLDRLQQLGVKIAIDDFGTKYSSFDYLETYRVSILKIPRSMIEAATKDSRDLAMVRAILGIARELDIGVVAQGIETEEERALLAAAPSTTKVQGYYYSAPVHSEDATELLRRRLIEPGFTRTRGQGSALCDAVTPI